MSAVRQQQQPTAAGFQSPSMMLCFDKKVTVYCIYLFIYLFRRKETLEASEGPESGFCRHEETFCWMVF